MPGNHVAISQREDTNLNVCADSDRFHVFYLVVRHTFDPWRQSATAHGSALMLAARMTLAQRFGFPVTVKAKDEIESGRAQTTSLEPHPGQGRIRIAITSSDDFRAKAAPRKSPAPSGAE